MRQHGRPAGPHRLHGGLGVGYVGSSEAATAAKWDPIATGQLGAGNGGPGPLRGTKGRGSALHVDIGGKASIYNGRPSSGELYEGDASQRFSVLLSDRGRHRDRTHRTCQDKRGHDQHLVGSGIGQHATQHAIVKAQRAAGVDHPAEDWFVRLRDVIAKNDLGHLDIV